jgi:hypothetical protein
VTVEYAAPPPAPAAVPSRDLAWISVSFIACWALPVFLAGLIQLVHAVITMHDLADLARPQDWPDPFPPGLDEALSVVGILALSLVVPGVVIGVIAILRSRPRAYLRATGLVVLVGAGVVGAFWVQSLDYEPTGAMGGVGGHVRQFLGDGGLRGVLAVAVSVAVALGSAYLLLARPSTKVGGSQR